jgi:hypothetical protein
MIAQLVEEKGSGCDTVSMAWEMREDWESGFLDKPTRD